MIKTVIIEGSSKPGSSVSKGSAWIASMIHSLNPDYETKVINPNDFSISFDGETNEKYTNTVRWADCLIIIIPEFNHGYPGRLKTLLDSELEAYKDKPAMLVGWSSGGFGGVRGVENILPVIHRLGLIPVVTTLHFSYHSSVFDQDGVLIDESYQQRCLDALVELFRMVKLLGEQPLA